MSASAPAVFVLEDPHDPVVMPLPRDQGRVPLRSFMRKSARAVTPDRSFVETQDTKLHPVQAHRLEGMIQCKAYGIPAEPPPLL